MYCKLETRPDFEMNLILKGNLGFHCLFERPPAGAIWGFKGRERARKSWELDYCSAGIWHYFKSKRGGSLQ
jgi:hypothetical protein